MSFLDRLILSTLNEFQGIPLTPEQIAEMIQTKDVEKIRHTLEMFVDSHYPVKKQGEGYLIPNDTISDYVIGIGGFSAILAAAFLF